MPYDLTESRFDFSDLEYSATLRELDVATGDVDDWQDIELLEQLNLYPRVIGKITAALEQVENEVVAREILTPNVPPTLDERTDDWLAERRNEIRGELSDNARKEETLKAERDEIDQEFVRRFRERQTSGTRAGRFTISMKMDDNYPEVTDRTSFEQYVLESGKLHLLQKRLSLSSVKEELAAFEQERKASLKKLNEEGFTREVCFTALSEIQEDHYPDDIINNKLDIWTATGRLEEGIVAEINEHYTIPGVNVVSKLTINQVKRN